jgi:hypothetical protein
MDERFLARERATLRLLSGIDHRPGTPECTKNHYRVDGGKPCRKSAQEATNVVLAGCKVVDPNTELGVATGWIVQHQGRAIFPSARFAP